MSRVGKQPIPIPSGVTVTINGNVVQVAGPRGELTGIVHPRIKIEVNDGQILVTRAGEDKLSRSLHGLTRTLVANMVQGVTQGFQKALEIVGVGYRADLQGRNLTLQVGFSHPVVFRVPDEIDLEVPSPTKVVVRGRDKQLVGQVAAQIRAVKKPEPYQGKGIRYEGEEVRRKAGKTGA